MPGKQEESTMTSILTRPLGASVAAALAAVLIIATPASATPGTTTVGDYMYSYDDADVAAGATITDYVGTDTVLTIPGTVTIGLNTYDVTSIGDAPFGTAGASTPLVSFYSAYASSGYTTPTWTAGGQAYRSEALGAVEAYITQVYQDLFDRTPDAGGLATWTGLLMAGTPYGEVANGITYSDEYRSRLIQASYQQYLGRAAQVLLVRRLDEPG